jgi:PTH1 family peptidyl-tRNA hydrolase
MTIFGLGNPGLKYRSTKHNAGYIFLDKISRTYRKRFTTKRGYKLEKIKIRGHHINLIKPICWMNQSGFAISSILQKIDDEFLIVLDDFNLSLGRIRLRSKGSDGGHLGLRSIINELGRSNFLRLRIGIGYPEDQDVVSYVLTKFTRKDKKILMSVIEKGIKGIEIMLKEGFAKAQNYINSINSSEIN